MLFSVRISECGNEWEVQGVRGELAGVVVAQAEAVFMSVTHISKDGEVLTGQIKAMWGTTLNDEMTTKPDVLRGLGIGYQLPKTVGKPLTDHGGGGSAGRSGRRRSFCERTGEPLKRGSRSQLFD